MIDKMVVPFMVDSLLTSNLSSCTDFSYTSM
jgi:hypothetical protein